MSDAASLILVKGRCVLLGSTLCTEVTQEGTSAPFLLSHLNEGLVFNLAALLLHMLGSRRQSEVVPASAEEEIGVKSWHAIRNDE